MQIIAAATIVGEGAALAAVPIAAGRNGSLLFSQMLLAVLSAENPLASESDQATAAASGDAGSSEEKPEPTDPPPVTAPGPMELALLLALQPIVLPPATASNVEPAGEDGAPGGYSVTQPVVPSAGAKAEDRPNGPSPALGGTPIPNQVLPVATGVAAAGARPVSPAPTEDPAEATAAYQTQAKYPLPAGHPEPSKAAAGARPVSPAPTGDPAEATAAYQAQAKYPLPAGYPEPSVAAAGARPVSPAPTGDPAEATAAYQTQAKYPLPAGYPEPSEAAAGTTTPSPELPHQTEPASGTAQTSVAAPALTHARTAEEHASESAVPADLSGSSAGTDGSRSPNGAVDPEAPRATGADRHYTGAANDTLTGAIIQTTADPGMAVSDPVRSPMRLAAPDIAEQFMSSARLLARANGGEAELQLRPEYLGRLHISMQVHNGVINLQLAAENATARQAILERLPDLAAALAAAGMTLAQANVTVGDQPRQRFSSSSDGKSATKTRPEEVVVSTDPLQWLVPASILDLSA